MYSVKRITHQSYGAVIAIERVVNGSVKTPFQAVQCACKEIRLWRESGIKKVRILIDEQVLSIKQAEAWSDEEYDSLAKCSGCATIMEEQIYTHQLCPYFFCSQVCADRDYSERVDKLKDEEEVECF